MWKPSTKIVDGNHLHRLCQGPAEFAFGSGVERTQDRFDLGDTFFNRIEVGRISRQMYDFCYSRLD